MWRMLLMVLLCVGPPNDTPSPPDPPLLTGPTVTVPKTLVRRDMTGAFLRIDGRPEEAALTLLTLSPESRSAALDAIRDRRNELSVFLMTEVDLVRDATDALLAGDDTGARAIQRQLYERFEPDQPRDPLLERWSTCLTDRERTEIQSLLDGYWQAWISWELRTQAPDDAKARRRVQRRLAFNLFQRDLRDAYDLSLRRFREQLEMLYAVVEPTDEQRAALRGIMIDHIRVNGDTADEAQITATTRRIVDILDDAQRLRLAEHALWR